jgi:uncharacterized damage-inducible protein DinB
MVTIEGRDMTRDEALQLFAYDAWANGEVFAAAEQLSQVQLTATIASSFSSIRSTLGHIVGAEWVWLRRWLGENPSAAPPWVEQASLSELKAQLSTIEEERARYLEAVTDVGLEQVVAYRSLKGEPDSQRLSGQLRHVVNHSSYHRGQVATQLRHLGVTPPSTDLIRFLRLPEGGGR